MRPRIGLRHLRVTTAGGELLSLLRLAAPIALTNWALVVMGLVDIAVLGRVSVEELAGASLGRTVTFAMATIPLGLVAALEPLASQSLGARDPAGAWGAFRGVLRLALLSCIPVIALSALAVSLLPACGVEQALARRALWYVLGEAPGRFAFVLYIAHKTLLQAHGDTKSTLRSALWANAINVVVCNLLVRGDDVLRQAHLPALGLPRMGALGAGLAASISTAVMAFLVWIRSRRYAVAHAAALPRRRILHLGVPLAVQLLAEVGVFALVAVLAGRLGPQVASAHQVAIGLASFTFMGALGVSGATAVRVGYAIGEGDNPRRAGWMGICIGGALQSAGALVFALAPLPLLRLFTSDAKTLEAGAHLLAIAAIFQLFDGVQVVAAGALRGAGDVRFPLVTMLVSYWALGLPLAAVLSFALGWGAPGLWWGMTLGLVVVAIVLPWRFHALTRRSVAALAASP